MRGRTARGIVSSLLIFLVGAFAAAAAQCSETVDRKDQEFIALPPAERQNELVRRPPDEQVRLFLLATKAEHRRDLGLADALASSGALVVPAIVIHLKSEEEHDQDRLYLLQVLGMMERFGYYDVSSDPNAVSAAKDAVARIEEPRFKQEAQASLRMILGEKSQF